MKYSRKNPIPEEIKEQIVNDYQTSENSSLKTVAEKHGTSIASVTAILEHKGIPRNARGRRKGSVHIVKINPSLYPEIIERYNNGESTVVLAPAYDVSRQAICDILKKTKCSRYVAMSEKRNAHKNLPTSIKNEIIGDYKDSKMSSLKLSDKWDINPFAIRTVLKDAGFNIRAGGFYHTKIEKSEYPKIEARYVSGERLPVIADDYGVSAGCIESILKKRKVKSQHKKRLSEYYEKCRKVPVSEYKAILQKLKDKQTIVSLSEEYNVSYGGMQLIIKRAKKTKS